MQVIIMTAGRGSRMRPLTDKVHKSLLPIGEHENFLSRMLHHLNEYEISKVVIVAGYLSSDIENVVNQYELNAEVVINDKYKDDTNIYSMKLALDKLNLNETVIILEADIYLDDLALRDIIYESQSDKSIWFTKNIFNSKQYGGILKCDKISNILDIQIVPKYQDIYSDYYKLLGIMTIGKNEIAKYKELVNKYVTQTIEQYYLIPWIENLSELPCISCNLGEYLVESVNKPEEYHIFVDFLQNKLYKEENIVLVNPNILLDIEEYIPERKDALKEKILKDGLWTRPIIIEKNYNLVLDGHHRFNIAKELGMTQIPAVLVDYKNIEIWSLKNSEKVNKELVIAKAKVGNIYPNKTVKHKFEFKVPSCKYNIAELY